MAFTNLVTPPYYDVLQYGTSTSDDTNLILNTIATCGAAGGGFVVLPKMHPISGQISITYPNVHLVGMGPGTGLQPTAGFAPGKIIFINGVDFCGVRDLQINYASTNSAGNPAADGIQISQGRYARIQNIEFFYLGGWCMQSIGSTGKSNLGTVVQNVHALHCQKGIHLQAKQTNWPGQHFLENINMEIIDSGDCLFLEDIDDIVVNNFLGAVAGGSGTGSPLHIRGAGASNFFTNMDIGVFPGPASAPTVLIDAGTNGSPSNLRFLGGVIQQGTMGVRIRAGKQLVFSGFKFGANTQYGVSVETTALDVLIEDSVFAQNGSGAGTYSINCSATNGKVKVANNSFQDAIGASANQVANYINATAGVVSVHDNEFIGTGAASSNIFAGLPTFIKNNYGYNPLGNITAPAIPASTVAYANAFGVDCTVFVNGGTVSAVAIGGVATGQTSGPFRIPSQQTITLTYTVAPSSWAWFGD